MIYIAEQETDRKVEATGLVAIVILLVVAFFGTILVITGKQPPVPANREQINEFYQVMVGSDSLSVLSTVQRTSALLDSICIQLSGSRCNAGY